MTRGAEASRTRRFSTLYNRRGTGEGAWLDTLHADLDRALAALLALNRARA